MLQRGTRNRKQEIDGEGFRLDFPKLHQHINDIFPGFSHADDAAAADFVAKTLQHPDVCDALIKGVGRADIRIVIPAAV